ncbi:hypothetical protein FA95DRAFT_1505012 [Auriscalpium vulgare]|uniref:Uncharacterized protein n=1 Tax=Auriscalpium vulgare TaxID=40419 RepID=A0ACB8R3X6_9AGAM|nr:hypothetical protein FA95DRAFT_1505012 [Auriscalpium vulgare]
MLQDFPLLSWIPHRDEYLDGLLLLEGRGQYESDSPCRTCKERPATIRCRDCAGFELLCVECSVALHARCPFHWTEAWNGTFFERAPLSSLGLRIQLCHAPGMRCGSLSPARDDFVVLHTNGIHKVKVDYCGCGLSTSLERRQQFMRSGLWPATVVDPQTAATFSCLDTFQQLSLQGKLSGYDFYKSLEILTDGSGLNIPPDRLTAFMTMAREWRHIKMMKRAGRGHDPTGIAGTGAGECAVTCPACPIPEVNLPEGWDTAPPSRSWLYRLIVAVDANFRLKSRLRSSSAKDPGLGTGTAYFVGDAEYERHLDKFKDEDVMSGCSRFSAVSAANLKSSKGLRATGVGGVCCARHGFWRPLGIADLQKGERYCNMDFVFLSSISSTTVKSLLVSYDIACQWSKNLKTRVANTSFSIPEWIRFMVPKFHIFAHKEECQDEYSPHKEYGAGQTDGEGVERGWSDVNGAAPSTKEMGPGGRHDTLDDQCGQSNWRRFTGLCMCSICALLLRRRLQVAIEKSEEHGDIYAEFTESLKSEHPEVLHEWEGTIEAWEADPAGKENPYRKPETELTVSDVRLELARDEHAALSAANDHVAEPAVGSFLLQGLRIESMQLKLRLDRQSDTTANQATLLQDARTSILRQIRRFRADQELHMPFVAPLIDAAESASSLSTEQPERIKLYLPSDFTAAQREELCLPALIATEAKLRHAGMSDALEDVRHQLRFRTYVNTWKVKNVRGQRPNTRARDMQARIEDSVKRAAETYRRHRAAYQGLSGNGAWQTRFQELKDEHLVGLGERMINAIDLADEQRVREYVRGRHPGGAASGESSHTVPWLWYAHGQGEGGEMEIDLKIEWFKARARSRRWIEEVLLLYEEMRRVVVTCTWRSEQWTSRGASGLRGDVSPHLHEGLMAYSCKQATMFRAFSEQFVSSWQIVRAAAETFLQSRQEDGRPLAPVHINVDVE